MIKSADMVAVKDKDENIQFIMRTDMDESMELISEFDGYDMLEVAESILYDVGFEHMYSCIGQLGLSQAEMNSLGFNMAGMILKAIEKYIHAYIELEELKETEDKKEYEEEQVVENGM
jgi:hypothetical protein